MDDQTLARDISIDVEQLDNTVRGIAAASHQRYRMSAAPGTVVPDFGEYEPADEDARAQIAAACSDAYAEIMEDVDRHISAAHRTMSEPASADDVATVTFALSREGITGDELQALLDRYKGNYQLASGIVERAHAAGVRLRDEPEGLRVYRSDADRAAARVLQRYNTHSVMLNAADFATDVVMHLRHIDFMGRAY